MYTMTLEEINLVNQTNDGGEIRCPAQSKRKDYGIPKIFPKFLLNDANLQQTLMINNARFHNPA